MRGVGGVRKSMDQSWLVKWLGLGLLCWGFKGVQEEIPSEEANTLQIGSMAFPPGQCTSPQLHPCHRLFDQDGQQDSFPSLSWINWQKIKDPTYSGIVCKMALVQKVSTDLRHVSFFIQQDAYASPSPDKPDVGNGLDPTMKLMMLDQIVPVALWVTWHNMHTCIYSMLILIHTQKKEKREGKREERKGKKVTRRQVKRKGGEKKKGSGNGWGKKGIMNEQKT